MRRTAAFVNPSPASKNWKSVCNPFRPLSSISAANVYEVVEGVVAMERK